MRTALILTALCLPAWAQEKWDTSIMFGGLDTSAAATSASIGWTWQWTSALLLHSSAAGNLNWYVETPLAFFNGEEVAGTRRAGSYFTPGVRLKIPTQTRISFYGALGGGISQFNEQDAVISGQLTATQDPSSAHPAADFGGGVDLRLSQFMSLRVDGRDYITPSGLGGTTGRNHPLFVAGIAFHL